jgi:WD40 repeat protein
MNAPPPDSFKRVKEFSRPQATFAVARDPASSRVYFGGADFGVYEADLAADKPDPKKLYAHTSYVTGVALAGNLLVSGGYDGKLMWWDARKREVLRTVDAHTKWIRRVVATADGTRIASVADDMVAKVWDTTTGKVIHDLKGHKERTPNDFPSMLFAGAFSPDGKHLATGDKTGHVVVWDVESGKQLATLEAPVMYTWDPVQRLHSIGGIRSVAFSPDGKHLAVGGIGKIGNVDHLDGKARVEVFDWAVGKQVAEFPGDKFNGLVEALVWSPSGTWLIGAGGANEGFFTFYDAAAKKVLRQEKLATHVHDVALSPAGDSFVLVGHNQIAKYSA